MDRISAAFQRQTKFEGGLITEKDAQGGYSINTAGRSADRTGQGRIRGDQYNAGERVITINGCILGHDPWVTE